MSRRQSTALVLTEPPKYSKILVGYDGSKNSQRALARAAEIARDDGASLTIVVVVNTTLMAFAPMAPPIPQEVFEDLMTSSKDILAQALASVAPFVSGASGTVEEGNPAENILKIAVAKGIDLIVLGRRGISGVERFLLGGVSSNVVSHSKCDVVVVK